MNFILPRLAPAYTPDKFAIQRVSDGQWVAPAYDTVVRDPHQARTWDTRAEVDAFLDENVLRPEFVVARFPATRALP